jgi:hypothetical protein
VVEKRNNGSGIAELLSRDDVEVDLVGVQVQDADVRRLPPYTAQRAGVDDPGGPAAFIPVPVGMAWNT